MREPNTGPLGAWEWQSTLAGDGTSIIAADPRRYTITFGRDAALQIRADCNRVLGTYTIDPPALRLLLGPSTLVGCPPDSQADDFVAGLIQVASYSLSRGTLALGLGPGEGRMTLIVVPTPELRGPAWQLLAYNNGRGGVQSILPETQPTVVFGADGRVSGTAGCNTFSGPFKEGRDSLSMGPFVTTRIACGQALMDQEAAFLAALQQTSTYQFDDGRLQLRDRGGATQALFGR